MAVVTYDSKTLPPSVGRLKIAPAVLVELKDAIEAGNPAGPDDTYASADEATKAGNAVRRNLIGTFPDIGKLGLRVFTQDGETFLYAIFPRKAATEAPAK